MYTGCHWETLCYGSSWRQFCKKYYTCYNVQNFIAAFLTMGIGNFEQFNLISRTAPWSRSRTQKLLKVLAKRKHPTCILKRHQLNRCVHDVAVFLQKLLIKIKTIYPRGKNQHTSCTAYHGEPLLCPCLRTTCNFFWLFF